MFKFCLGTVQLGLDYGINNKLGKPSLNDSIDILKQAYNSGVRLLDTAKAYGNAEKIIGLYHEKYPEKKFSVITKVLPNSLDDSLNKKDAIEQQIRDSLNQLNIESLDGVLLHTPNYVYNEKIIEGLSNLKDLGLVKHIGVSIYEVEDAMYAVNLRAIDYIQIMYSVFDQRISKTNFFELAKMNGVTVFARSVFLQGLVFMREALLPDYLSHGETLLNKLNVMAQKYEIPVADICYNFTRSNGLIDYLVIGIDNLDQLNYNINLESKFNESDFLCRLNEEIINEFNDVEKSIILPSMWKKT